MNRPRGGKNSNFEKDFQARFKSLGIKLDAHSDKISKILTKSLISKQASSAYWNGIRAEIAAEYKAMATAFNTFAATEIPLSFRSSLKDIQRRIEATGKITETANKNITALLNSTKSRNLQNILYQDAISSYAQALSAGKEQLFRFTRKTQQALVDESLLDVKLAEAIEGGNIRTFYGRLIQASPEWAKTLDILNGKNFVTVAGRRYKADYYAELVARTKFHEAQSAATLQQCSNYDTDLVIISSHNTTTAICKPYEGRMFSVSGKDKRFPPLENTPPFHPNCLHLMFPYFESALRAEGTEQAWSDFSQGRTDRPPSPASYNPNSAGKGVA